MNILKATFWGVLFISILLIFYSFTSKPIDWKIGVLGLVTLIIIITLKLKEK